VAAAEDVGPEHLGRRSEAQALARRGIETGAELAQLLLRKRVRVGIAADPAAQVLISTWN